ncbi:hypothetical protein [Nostoc commune]|nr:hypothetical protein [Nostoc commune]
MVKARDAMNRRLYKRRDESPSLQEYNLFKLLYCLRSRLTCLHNIHQPNE